MNMTIAASKTCPKCKETKDLSDFGVWGPYKGSKSGQPRTYCRSCERENSKSSYQRGKQKRQEGITSRRIGYVVCSHGQIHDLLKHGDEYQLMVSRD